MGLLAAAVLGGAVLVQAKESTCPADAEKAESAKTESHISIIKGFQKLGRETGIYRFFNPQTKEEKAAAYKAALVKTVEAEISAGHFHGAYEQVHKAHGVDQVLLDQLENRIAEAESLRLKDLPNMIMLVRLRERPSVMLRGTDRIPC